MSKGCFMKNIFITGANRGLGFEFTKQYLEMGERVFAGARNPDQAISLHQLKEEYKDNLTLIKLEVNKQEDIDSAVSSIKTRGHGIDILINNAAIKNEREGFGNLEMTSMLKVFEVNVMSPVLIIQQFMPLLKKGNKPLVINISSSLGSIGRNGGTILTYSSSKAALNMFTNRLAVPLKQNGIIIIVMDPGWVQTDLGGSNADLTPPESISGMIDVIEKLNIKDTGRYYRYNGEELPW